MLDSNLAFLPSVRQKKRRKKGKGLSLLRTRGENRRRRGGRGLLKLGCRREGGESGGVLSRYKRSPWRFEGSRTGVCVRRSLWEGEKVASRRLGGKGVRQKASIAVRCCETPFIVHRASKKGEGRSKSKVYLACRSVRKKKSLVIYLRSGAIPVTTLGLSFSGQRDYEKEGGRDLFQSSSEENRRGHFRGSRSCSRRSAQK